MNKKVDIEIGKRRLTVEMEGLDPLQILGLAQQVQTKLDEVATRHPHIVDTSKAAILTALELAAELQQLKDASAVASDALENKLAEFTLSLQSALSQTRP